MANVYNSSSAVKVDDTSIDIVYSGNWTTDSTNAGFFDSTHTFTSTAGATAGFTFTGPLFSNTGAIHGTSTDPPAGSAIEVWGAVFAEAESGMPSATYNIDGAEYGPITVPYFIVGDHRMPYLHWRSPPLSNASHTLLA